MKGLHSKNYHLMFQTNSVFLFFSDVTSRFYLRFDNLIFQQREVYQQLLPLSYQEAAHMAYQEWYQSAAAVERFCADLDATRDEFLEFGDDLKAQQLVSLEIYDRFIALTKKISEEYHKLDPIYTDFLFSDPRPGAASLIALVTERKNKSREYINDVFFAAGSPMDTIFKKMATQLSLPEEKLRYLSIAEVRRLIEGGEYQDFYKGNMDYVVVREEDKYTYLFGNEATSFINDFLADTDLAASEVKGNSVSKKGVYQGRVKKVLIDYRDFKASIEAANRVDAGCVLVTDSTVPEVVPLMSKSLAIVTDVGGMLSHAAITSRELGVPCVVGTQIATKIFKDGDLVEVNADTGVIKKL